LGITPKHHALDLDHRNKDFELLHWYEYKVIMDSLLAAKHGPGFLDSLCATVNVPVRK
jgi:hypothetical protein